MRLTVLPALPSSDPSGKSEGVPSEELPKMSYRTSRWGASEGPNRGSGTSRDLLLSMLLIHMFYINLSPTLAKETVVEYTSMTLHRNTKNTTMSMCMKLLEGPPTFRMLLRMEVKPIGPGSNRVHMAGSVTVPNDFLQVGTGWSRLHYKYTSVDKNLVLKVWLNDVELPYKPTRDMYNGRYELNAVKIYMQGRVEIFDGDDCPQPPTTTEPPATISVMVPHTSPSNPTKSAIREEPSQTTSGTPKPPAANTLVTFPAFTTEAGTHSWIQTLGSVGSVPILVLILVGVVVLLLVTVLAIILWRHKNSKKREATPIPSKKNQDHSRDCNESFMDPSAQSTNAEDFADNPQDAPFSPVNPMYKSPPPYMNRAPLLPPSNNHGR